MRNIILITAASTLLLASGTWAGGPYPMIDFDDGECYIYDEDKIRVLLGVGLNMRLLEKEKDGITEMIATCSGNERELITDGSFKKPIHFNKDNVPSNPHCQIIPEEASSEWTAEWRQVLRKNGGFSLKCIKILGP